MNRRQVLIGAGAATLAAGAAGYAGWKQMGSMRDYNAAVAAMRSRLDALPETTDLIRNAGLAASGHNTQPWIFRLEPNSIRILPDFARRTPVVDPDDHHVFVSLGCAAENLAVAGDAWGRPGEVTYDAAGDGSVLFVHGKERAAALERLKAVAQRQSTRSVYDGASVSAENLKRLAAAAAIPGISVILLTDKIETARIRDLVLAGNTAQMRDPAFVRELRSWLRFSPREALQSGDGLFSAASGNPVLPAWLGPRLFDWVFNEASENEKYARHLNSSSGVAVFIADTADQDHWVRAGRASQRFALQATALGIRTAFVNQPVEVEEFRRELASLVGLPGRRPDLVMRFGYGPELPYSARRPVRATLQP